MSNSYLDFFKREMPLFVAYAKEHYSDILPSSAFNEIECIMQEVLESCAQHGNRDGDLCSIFSYFYSSYIWAASVANKLYNVFYWEDNTIRHLYASPYEVITSKSVGSVLFKKFGTIPCKVTRQAAILLALRSVQFRAFTPIEDRDDQWLAYSTDKNDLVHIRESGLFKNKETGECKYLCALYCHVPNSNYSSWIAYPRSGKVKMPLDVTSSKHIYYTDGSFTREIELNQNTHLDLEFFKRFKKIITLDDYTYDECVLAKKIFTLMLCNFDGGDTFTTISADMARYHVSHYGYKAEEYLKKIDFTNATDEMRKDILNTLKPILRCEHQSYRKIWDLVGYLYYMVGERETLSVYKDCISINRNGNHELGFNLFVCPTGSAIFNTLNPSEVIPRHNGFHMFKAIPRRVDCNKYNGFLYLNPNWLSEPKKYLDWNDDVTDAYSAERRKVVIGGEAERVANAVSPKTYGLKFVDNRIPYTYDNSYEAIKPESIAKLTTVFDTSKMTEICGRAAEAKAIMDSIPRYEPNAECENNTCSDSSDNSSFD